MASLVANYGSDSEDEPDSDAEKGEKSEVPPDKAVKSQNYFEGVNSDSSSSDQEEIDTSKSKRDNSNKLPNPLIETLPSISECLGNADNSASVFKNRFDLAEKEKNAILEKHVKMTEAKIVSGKAGQICWKFKKGKCRFGKSCKYSHDLESNRILNQNNPSADNECNNTPVPHQANVSNFNSGDQTFSSTNKMYSQTNSAVIPQFGMPIPPEPVDDDNYMASAKKKKRSGVSDHLVPPKKAMLALQKQRQEERPWTVQK